ncbi:MAG: glycine cleavage system aminomethyltransferase GcvT [Acidobacteria bacterium]|jgi:aminomethyltransferase|nr:glycine cleavage system aminomethyltransferase GcvT [Acidobacteriota bacterium]
MENLKKTPLNRVHRELGGKMVDFGGWDMPVQYSGVIAEHLRTREHSGLFDVSHMGEFYVEGEDAIAFVDKLTTNDVTKLIDGQAHYSALTREDGTVVDDLLVYRFDGGKLLLVVNAGTTEKDWDWITSHKADENITLTNASADYCQIAVQGKDALSIVQKLTDTNLEEIKYYHFTVGKVDGVDAIISRTGYTGEDGFEVYANKDYAEQLWNKFLETGNFGEETGILPCGLAARNTLRLESAMSLYGHEISDEITPLEANLGWICKLNKGEFLGRDALAKLKEKGLERKLVGFEMIDKGIARDGFDVYVNDKKVGYVTSGSPAPFLKKNIGLAFVPVDLANIGQAIKIDVRGKHLAAEIVPTPFYKRKGK